MINSKIKYLALITALLAIVSVILSLTSLTLIQSLRITFGSVFVLFLPGFVMTYIFFKKIDWIERITLSFALSIAIVPLIMFYFNKIGLKINTLNSFIIITCIILISLIIIKIRKNKRN